MPAKIIYNGNELTSISGKKKTTFRTADKTLVSDLVVELDEQSAGGQIIEVTELPTENIDENALYLCKGAYYKYANEFVDVIVAASGDTVGYAELAANGMIISFNIIPTKITDGILVSGENVLHFYYIEDEDEDGIFCYDGDTNGWLSLSAVGLGAYNGIIADKSEATEEGYYAVMNSGWTKYSDNSLPNEISTEAEMTALLETAKVGSIYKYTGESGTYERGALYVVEESE